MLEQDGRDAETMMRVIDGKGDLCRGGGLALAPRAGADTLLGGGGSDTLYGDAGDVNRDAACDDLLDGGAELLKFSANGEED